MIPLLRILQWLPIVVTIKFIFLILAPVCMPWLWSDFCFHFHLRSLSTSSQPFSHTCLLSASQTYKALPATGPLHLLFSLPKNLFPLFFTWLFPSNSLVLNWNAPSSWGCHWESFDNYVLLISICLCFLHSTWPKYKIFAYFSLLTYFSLYPLLECKLYNGRRHVYPVQQFNPTTYWVNELLCTGVVRKGYLEEVEFEVGFWKTEG